MPDPPQAQTSEELAVVLKELENKTERLKQLYEQYFMGIERIQPMVARKEVQRAMITLQQNYIRNTALRFKFNTMLQRWSMYTTYWNRTLREIENGTYVRHLQKAAREAEKRGDALPSEMRKRRMTAAEKVAEKHAMRKAAEIARTTPAAGVPGMKAPTPPGGMIAPGVPGAKGAVPPPLPPGAKGAIPPPLPPGAKGPPPLPGQKAPTPPRGTVLETPTHGVPISLTPPQGTPRVQTPPQGVPRPQVHVPGMSEDELRQLHKRYSDARSAAGDAAPVRYETLVASLAKQVPTVLARPGVKGVRFDVEVKDGKPILKAFPKK